MAEHWSISGTYFDACSCDVGCPCYFGSRPPEGKCNGIICWHIDKGSYGDVTLDGLNVVLWADVPGHLLEVKWRIALYMDERASEAQRDALTRIFSGEVGGHLATLTPFIGEVLGVKSAAIDYREEGKRRSLRIAHVADVEFEPMEGQEGAAVTISNQPIAVAPGQTLTVGKSMRASYRDHEFDWEVSGKNVYSSPFAYQGP